MTAVTDLRAYVQLVERGGFAAASKALGLTPSAVAKLVTRLGASHSPRGPEGRSLSCVRVPGVASSSELP